MVIAGKIINYVRLTKPILSGAIALSSSVGLYLFNETYNIILFAGVFLLSSGASGINQVIEREADKKMLRTAGRPIPSGKIKAIEANVFSIMLIALGSYILYQYSIISMLLGLLNILIYSFVYTPLKYRTNLFLLAGGLVGALPPLIGWYASGTAILMPSIIFFSVFMYLWQIPHFIILNLKYKDDYKMGGIKTLTDSMDNQKIKNILTVWIVSMVILSLVFPLTGIIEGIKLVIALILLNAMVIAGLLIMLFNKEQRFKYSLSMLNIFIHIYLVLVFMIMMR